MKKIILFFVALALLLVGCVESKNEQVAEININLSAENFVEGNHKRVNDYMASFKTKTVILDGLEISFASDVYDEALSPAMAEEIARTFYAMHSYCPERARSVKLYIVSLTTTGGPVLINNRLYVSETCLSNNEYIPWLASCIYDIDDWWRCVGLSLTTSGDKIFVEDELIYTEKSKLLSLHPCYFVDAFTDEATRRLAKNTARSLTEFIISEEGFEAFLDRGNELSYRKDWLESIGLEYDLNWLETSAASRLENMRFSYTDDIPMILSEADFKLNMHNVDWLENADVAYNFLLDFCDGTEKIYKRFESEAPSFHAHLIDDTDITAVQFRNSDHPISSRASMLKDEAIVTDDADVLHEITHTLMPRASIYEAFWLCEGLVTYLTAPHVSYYADSIVVDSVMTEYEGDTADVILLRSETIRVFEALNGCDASNVYTMEQPIYKIYEAMGYAAFLNPENNSAPVATQSIKNHYGEILANNFSVSYPANELSYLESMLFVEWLVEKYGLDTLIWAEMDAERYFELFPSAEDFKIEFDAFWDARVEPLIS